MQTMLGHLDLLAKHDRNQLMKLCGVDAEDLADMVTEIRALNPKPGLCFEHRDVETVIPDILVSRRPDGSWSVELNTDTLPRLLVNQQYHALVSSKAHNKAEKDYISDRLAAANWLVKTLHQRATTILKVASEIIRQQEMFLLHGVQHLKPLIRRDIAEAIGMHEHGQPGDHQQVHGDPARPVRASLLLQRDDSGRPTARTAIPPRRSGPALRI